MRGPGFLQVGFFSCQLQTKKSTQHSTAQLQSVKTENSRSPEIILTFVISCMRFYTFIIFDVSFVASNLIYYCYFIERGQSLFNFD